MNVGYGAGGASAQVGQLGTPWMPDREVMQRLILQGRSVIDVHKFCSNLRCLRADADGVRRKMSFPKKAFEEVVKAAFAQYPVGKLLHAGSSRSCVQLSAPPTGDDSRAEKVLYHNMLVNLCRVSCRQFTEKLATRVSDTSAARSAALHHFLVTRSVWCTVMRFVGSRTHRRTPYDV